MENQISVLIVEDEEIWLESLNKILIDFGFLVVRAVSTVEDALIAFAECDYDLILMDIHLDGRNSGIELGKIVSKLYKKPFIFITASNGHNMADAASANPSAYLPKPINASSLFVAIQNAIHNFNNDHVPPVEQSIKQDISSFFVKQGNRYKKIEWKDVAYLAAGKNYISVYNAPDKTEYYIRSSLNKVLNHLVPVSIQQHFIQINRSEVVQYSFIEEIVNDEVKTSFKTFTVSENYLKELRNKIKIL